MMKPVETRLTAVFCLLAASIAVPTPGLAQLQAPQNLPDPAAKPQAQPKPKSPPSAAQPGKGAAPATGQKDDVPTARPAGEPALRQRIDQLEEQLADMQVVIGTLESLGRGGAAPAPSDAAFRTAAPGGGREHSGGVDQARIDSLETQMRAISDQLEQLTVQVRQLTGRRSELPANPPPAAEPPPSRTASQDAARVPGFGSVTVTPGENSDPIGRLITSTPGPAVPASPTSAQPSLPLAAAGAGNAKELYETAYGYLLQQDYPAAESAFEEFMRRHPTDRLAPDAQYWLGEALYVQRKYKPAGQAFLRVIEQHKTSNKVPNSLLKLATVLDQIGQKDCALFEELETRHPNASADIKSKSRTLKQRVGC